VRQQPGRLLRPSPLREHPEAAEPERARTVSPFDSADGSAAAERPDVGDVGKVARRWYSQGEGAVEKRVVSEGSEGQRD